MHMDPVAFAESWLSAWNAHDIERVLSHFHEYAYFSSPFAHRLFPESGGMLRGKTQIRAYWTAGLHAIPDLHFTVEAVFVGIDHIVLVYRNQAGVQVSEVLQFADGLVIEGHGTYPPDVTNPAGVRA